LAQHVRKQQTAVLGVAGPPQLRFACLPCAPHNNKQDEDDPPGDCGADAPPGDDPPASATAGEEGDPPAAAAAAVSGDCPAGDGVHCGEGDNPGSHDNPGIYQDEDREFASHPDGTVSEVLHVAKALVGKLIGKGGGTIMGLQSSTGCSIQVDQNTLSREGECRRVTLKGAPGALEAAKTAIHATLAAEGTGVVPAGGGGETSTDVSCPPSVVGRIIGRAGETIKLLQAASGAYILVNQNFPEGHDRQITITGTQDAVERATNMVRDLIDNDQTSVQAVIQRVRTAALGLVCAWGGGEGARVFVLCWGFAQRCSFDR